MAHSENLGLGKTHKPKLVTLFLKQMAYVPLAPFYLASKFFLHSPNARGFHTPIITLQISHIQFEMTAHNKKPAVIAGFLVL